MKEYNSEGRLAFKTIKVCFSASFTTGYDQLYTYKTLDKLQPNMLAWVTTADGAKKVLVVSIDADYDTKAEKRFGELAIATAKQPASLAPHTAVSHL